MPKDTETDVGERYAAARLTHHEAKDLGGALELYKAIIADHPDTEEAGYSRSQLQNIVNAVVPEQELFDAQLALASACLARASSPDVTPNQVTP